MKVIIYGRTFKEEYSDKIKKLFHLLLRNNIEIVVYRKYFELIKPSLDGFQKITLFASLKDFPSDSDFLISLGGDGTFLETITFVRDSNIPIVGINFGRLGFLAHIAENEIDEAVKDIISGTYEVEERALLKLQTEPPVFKDFPYALNEVTIQKKDFSLITIHTYIDDHMLNSFWADGLIVSTPTGSTAYSMSVGGPILTPDSKNIIISPIAPHTLTVRPIVVPNTCTLTFSIEGRGQHFITSIDSRFEVCDISTKMRINLADFTIKIVKLSRHEFFHTIRNKLMWGADKRN